MTILIKTCLTLLVITGLWHFVVKIWVRMKSNEDLYELSKDLDNHTLTRHPVMKIWGILLLIDIIIVPITLISLIFSL